MRKQKFDATQSDKFRVALFSATHRLGVASSVARFRSNVLLRGRACTFVACASRTDGLVQCVGGPLGILTTYGFLSICSGFCPREE
jgi:hypothetical protein